MDDERSSPRLTTWQAALCMVGLLLAMATVALAIFAMSMRGVGRPSFDCLPGDHDDPRCETAA